MAFKSFIDNIRSGDILGSISSGLSMIPVVGQGLGNIVEMSAGRKTYGQAIKETATSAGLGLVVPAASAVGTGTAKLALKAATPTAAKTIGGNITTPVNTTLDAAQAITVQASGSGALSLLQKGAGKVKEFTTGSTTGQAASLKNTAAPDLRPKATVAMAPVPSAKPDLRPKAAVTTATSSTGIGAQIKAGAGKAIGQYGVQGALSLISAGMAAKQAGAANEVSKQSLLFQQQTYQEQKAEREKTKAELKASAAKSYESSLLFGESLQQSNPSSANLFTNYESAPSDTGSNYSLLSSSIASMIKNK